MTKPVETFYEAFSRRDGDAMAKCYCDDVEFSDPIFPALHGEKAKMMWRMLCTRSSDLEVKFRTLETGPEKHVVAWDAWYTFSKSGRRVHNRCRAELWVRDGKIYRHRDHFSFWRWAAQALGIPGATLGWAPFFKAKVRAQAAASLAQYLAGKSPAAGPPSTSGHRN